MHAFSVCIKFDESICEYNVIDSLVKTDIKL